MATTPSKRWKRSNATKWTDRYCGISGGRRVILIHPEDLAELGFEDRDLVDVVSTFRGHDRTADKFQLVAYPTAKGCAAAYFPEANAPGPQGKRGPRIQHPRLQGHVRPLHAAPHEDESRLALEPPNVPGSWAGVQGHFWALQYPIDGPQTLWAWTWHCLALSRLAGLN